MSWQLRNSLLIFALVLVFAAAAYVIADEAAGTIRSVDAKSRTVVLRVEKDKALELTLSRKAKITIDGKEESVEGLHAGLKASVTYSTDTEIATDIKAATDTNVADEAAADLKWLQGEWTATAEWAEGKQLTKPELKELNKRMTVQGNRMTIKFVFQKKLGTSDGRFELNATTMPKQFDWTGNTDGTARELVGIYEIDKDLDQIKLYYVRHSKNASTVPRPTSFSSLGGKAVGTTFKRDKN